MKMYLRNFSAHISNRLRVGQLIQAMTIIEGPKHLKWLYVPCGCQRYSLLILPLPPHPPLSSLLHPFHFIWSTSSLSTLNATPCTPNALGHGDSEYVFTQSVCVPSIFKIELVSLAVNATSNYIVPGFNAHTHTHSHTHTNANTNAHTSSQAQHA